MIDSHCHLDAASFDTDREAAIERAWAAGLTAIVVPGVAPATWAALRQLTLSHPRIFAAAGIHPQLLPELDARQDDLHLANLDDQLSLGGWVAVGECGLDGPSVAAGASMERQLSVLRAHLTLAKKHGLPLMVHCFRTHPELRTLLEGEGIPPAGMVIHSYSGGAELVKVFAPFGCYFGLAGPVTYAKARKPLESARAIPLDRLLIETDAPDQTPAPHRTVRNEPAFLPLIAEAIGQARGMSGEEVARQASANARALFRLPP